MCDKQIDIQGHRGARGLMPENTIVGFVHALELGVHTLEMDLVVTADKQVVVSHEPWMNPKICLDQNGKKISTNEAMGYNIFKMQYSDVICFDCGTKFHPDFPLQKKMKTVKPLLSEVLEVCEIYWQKSYRKPPRYNLEIKRKAGYDGLYHPEYKSFVDLVMKTVGDSPAGDRCCIQSFDLNTLRYLHDHYPEQTIAYLVESEGHVREKLDMLGFTPQVYSPDFHLLNRESIGFLHQEDIKVIPWTVNEVSDMQNMLKLGADGIITDYPDRLIALLNSPTAYTLFPRSE